MLPTSVIPTQPLRKGFGLSRLPVGSFPYLFFAKRIGVSSRKRSLNVAAARAAHRPACQIRPAQTLQRRYPRAAGFHHTAHFAQGHSITVRCFASAKQLGREKARKHTPRWHLGFYLPFARHVPRNDAIASSSQGSAAPAARKSPTAAFAFSKVIHSVSGTSGADHLSRR